MAIRVLMMAASMEGGGSEHQTLLLLKYLNRQRFAPELYLGARRGPLLDRVPSDVPIHVADNSGGLLMHWPGRIHTRNVHRLRRLVRERQIDVVYDRTFHMTLIAGAACRGRIARVSTIVSPPDRDLPHSERRFLSIKRQRLARAYAQAHRVLAVSEAVRRSSIEYYGLSAEHVTTLPSGIDLADLRARGRGPLEAVLHEEDLNICCVGRLTREKGQDLLIAAVEGLVRARPPMRRRVVVWIAGDGNERPALERLVAARGLRDDVRFLGHLASAAPLVARCDVLVCPSRHEGLPNAILEAFALGTAVIACDVGGIPEIVTPGTGVLVPPENPAALADAILRILENPRATEATTAAAVREVEQRYALRPYLDRIETYLAGAAAKGGVGRGG